MGAPLTLWRATLILLGLGLLNAVLAWLVTEGQYTVLMAGVIAALVPVAVLQPWRTR